MFLGSNKVDKGATNINVLQFSNIHVYGQRGLGAACIANRVIVRLGIYLIKLKNIIKKKKAISVCASISNLRAEVQCALSIT